jgi:CRP/FNR family cyclic AMP-dependent transcriptional regulator
MVSHLHALNPAPNHTFTEQPLSDIVLGLDALLSSRIENAAGSQFTDDEIQYLQAHATVKHYKKNHHVFEKGDDGDCFFLILKGQVEVYVEQQVARTLICRLGPGECFGEISLLTGGTRTASVMTTEDSQFAVIRRSVFSDCLHKRPSLWLTMVGKLIHMVNDLTEKLSMFALDAYGRIRFYLYRLAQDVDGELVIEGHWTQQHLAELSGCRRETVAKILSALERGGWLQREKRQIRLLKRLPDRF